MAPELWDRNAHNSNHFGKAAHQNENAAFDYRMGTPDTEKIRFKTIDAN